LLSDKVYFKQNILVEPLFNQWYAWSNLIPPASAAMYIANSHLKIMESFVASPQMHIAALKNPAMLGGPFINYDAGKVGEIKLLAEKIRREQAPLLELAASIKKLDDMLQSEASGYSLESFYPRVPDNLRGYVELTYDLHNHPSVRFMEGLLYRSKYYNPASQSVSLSQLDSDNRAFVFSTPRLRSEERLFLNVPFNHEGLDELFKMHFVAQPYARIKEILHVSDEEDALFSSFFTPEEPARSARYEGEQVRVRYFGHACLLIETRDVSILCDPVISYKDNRNIDRYVSADLPETIDYVIITHGHQDHIIFEPLLQLRHKIRNLVVPKSSGANRADPSLKLLLETVGFRNVRELDEMESIPVEGGSITALPFLGEHADLAVRSKTAYFVELLGKSIVLAADSNGLEPRLYEHLHELFGDIDALFLGMECEGAPMSWLYGPLFTIPITRKNDQSRRLDGSTCERGMAIVDVLKPKQVYVYAMGQEPWLTFLTSIQYTDQSPPIVESDKLIGQCHGCGITSERLYIHKEMFL
jgi:L-ascorbate metabolism protein UlaG (beta-lactamase superfamily)